MPQQAADSLFTALARGAVDQAELAILGSGADQAVDQALAAQMSAAGSAQAKISSRLLRGDAGEADWLDGSREWPQ